jgi:hypothetical protein
MRTVQPSKFYGTEAYTSKFQYKIRNTWTMVQNAITFDQKQRSRTAVPVPARTNVLYYRERNRCCKRKMDRYPGFSKKGS